MITPPFPDQTFRTFNEWVNMASSRLTEHPAYNNTEHGKAKGWRGDHFTAMAFDSLGRRCRNGADMMRARDEDAFPVWWVWPDQVVSLMGIQIDKLRSLEEEVARLRREAVTTNHPRPLAEWNEDDGDVVWWTWRDGEWLGEPAYIGSPLCLGFGVPVSVGENEFVANVGGWPGYHTHWTPHPPFPDFTSREPENG